MLTVCVLSDIELAKNHDGLATVISTFGGVCFMREVDATIVRCENKVSYIGIA